MSRPRVRGRLVRVGGHAGRPGWFSPSYGVKVEAPLLELRATAVAVRLGFAVAPAAARTELEEWLQRELAS